ncbi:protein kinase [Nodosilinea sp. LEGE 07298]|uniref:serine/threonine-protein kinase n=1 Tax=Nodosilinea sp. LEGE 07298 TaxID=2777970 RepID=UPI00188297F8|nr:serine/threonine-protein kinase [Nodosilinea sp. LEGE 07298]MBE9112528.1 protein kinase [Nodosilinea sp. LEGE 07298]
MKPRALEQLFKLMPDSILGDNHYLLETCLGSGTHGVVWKAKNLREDRTVALKFPKTQGSRDRDLAEGQALLDKEHPNLVRMFWMGRIPPERSLYAIEMEYFNGQTLAFLLDGENSSLVASYHYLLHLYQQVLSGVAYLHELGLIHGDIKPQNVLVQNKQVKVTDFGSSVTTEDIYSRSRETGGTALYSAPESVVIGPHAEITKSLVAKDIYSLGVVLYQLLTGRLPHDTPAQVLRHTPFLTPRELSTSICPEMDAVVMRCLQRNPEDRWPSAHELQVEFSKAASLQLQYHSDRPLQLPYTTVEDWSSRVMLYFQKEDWQQAESVARNEFLRSQDFHAGLFMLRSAFLDERYLQAVEYLEGYPELLEQEHEAIGEVELLALEAYLRCDRIFEAEKMVERCLQRQGERPVLLIRKASVLGIQARYDEAKNILIQLNRLRPGKITILKRLVTVFEQLRDFSKADAFRRELQKQLNQRAA